MADKADTKTSPPDGMMSFVTNRISTKPKYVGNASIEVRGLLWTVSTSKTSKSLHVRLTCKAPQLSEWKIDVDVQFTIFNSDTSESIVREVSSSFPTDNSLWTRLLKTVDENEIKGFVVDDSVTLECRFWITNVKGLTFLPRIDFFDSEDPCHDVTIVINGKKFHVSKQILAVHSHVFKAMLYGDWDEKTKKEIELKDVNRQDFHEMLKLLYPPHWMVTYRTCKFLLKLANQYQVMVVMDRVAKFIADSPLFYNVEKLHIAEQYGLYGLQELCLTALKSTEDFKAIENSPIYEDLSNDMKAVLFDRLLRIAK